MFLLQLDLSLQLFNGLIDIALGILGDTQDGFFAGEAVRADGSLELGSGPAEPLLELALERGFPWRGEKGQRRNGPHECVEVDTEPDKETLAEVEDEKRGGCEGERGLGTEEGCDVVVALLGGRLS